MGQSGIVRDVCKSAVFNTALASGRGRTTMGENGRGVHCDGSKGADPQFFVMDLNALAKPERRI